MSIASVPSGHGNELVAVALYDEWEWHVWRAFQAALQIVNVSHLDVRADQGELNKVESHTTSMPGLAQIICQFFHLFRLFTAHSQTFNSFYLSLPQVLDGGFFAGLNRSAFLLHKCLVICSS